MPGASDERASGPKMSKPSEASVERFKRAVGDDPRSSLRPMFGNLAAFANGYLFAGLFGDDVFVRVDEPTQEAILGQGGQLFAPMPGRPMRDYAVLPTAWTTDDTELRARIASSLAFTMALPPKAPKPPKAAKTSKGGTAASGEKA